MRSVLTSIIALAASAAGFGAQFDNVIYVSDHNLATTDQSAIVRVDTVTKSQVVVATGGYLTDLFGVYQDSPNTVLTALGGGLLVRIDVNTGVQTLVASGLGHSTGQIAMDPAGNIFVCDDGFGGPGGVWKIDPNGRPTLFHAGNRPGGMVFHPDGNLYVTVIDMGNRTGGGIARLDPVTMDWTPLSGDGLVNDAYALAVDINGDLLVANAGTFSTADNEIIRYNIATQKAKVISTAPGLHFPRGIWVDSAGQIYLADCGTISPNTGAGIYLLDPVTGNTSPLSTNGVFKNVVIASGSPAYPSATTIALNQTVTQLRSALTAADVAIAALQNDNATLTRSLAAADVTIATLQNDNATLTRLLAAANATIAQLNSDKQTLQTQVSTLTSQLNAANTTNAQLMAQNLALQNSVTQLQAQAATTAAQVDSIRLFFATQFKSPQFVIAGPTTADKITSLSRAIQMLNPGQQQALYFNLGGTK